MTIPVFFVFYKHACCKKHNLYVQQRAGRTYCFKAQKGCAIRFWHLLSQLADKFRDEQRCILFEVDLAKVSFANK